MRAHPEAYLSWVRYWSARREYETTPWSMEIEGHDEGLATSRFSMMRIMARRMKAATVLA
jgi:hypothetical protein